MGPATPANGKPRQRGWCPHPRAAAHAPLPSMARICRSRI